MAKKRRTVTTDDLDGSPGAETVSFSIDGVDYEIDLGPANRQRLHEDLQPFANAGRRIHQGRLSVKTAQSPQIATTGDATDGIAQPHVITPRCPLTCIEGLLPGRSFIALNRCLRGEELVHPLVLDVVDLYQRTGLAGVRGLGAQGIELTTTLLESAGLVPPRPDRPGQQSELELMKRLAL